MLIFSCMCLPHFIYSSVIGHLGFFYLLSVIINVVMKVGVQISACASFGYIPGVEFLDQMIVLFLIFWGFAVSFSTAAACSYQFCIRIPIFSHPTYHLLFFKKIDILMMWSGIYGFWFTFSKWPMVLKTFSCSY